MLMVLPRLMGIFYGYVSLREGRFKYHIHKTCRISFGACGLVPPIPFVRVLPGTKSEALGPMLLVNNKVLYKHELHYYCIWRRPQKPFFAIRKPWLSCFMAREGSSMVPIATCSLKGFKKASRSTAQVQ